MIWTVEEALKKLLNKKGTFKAGTCSDSDDWFLKRNFLDLKEFILEKTSFLNDENVTFHHRLFYFKNFLNKKQLCPYCNKHILQINFCEKKFFASCNDNLCLKKMRSDVSKQMHKDLSPEKKILKNERISNSSKGSWDDKFGKEKSHIRKQKCREINQGKKQSFETKQKRINSRKNNGKDWHSLETKKKISQSNKKTHLSKEFKEKYKQKYNEGYKKQSITMKLKIANGEFTPNITNTWTRRDAYIIVNNVKIKFRSSWEAIFWYSNQHLKYEYVRIPYCFDGKEHNYIVDFYDIDNKILYEVKPKANLGIKKEQAKLEAAEFWCEKNDHKLEIITNDWFLNNRSLIINCLNDQKHLEMFMRQFL